jgi:hypothetical protein
LTTKRVLKTDPITGEVTTFEFDDLTNKAVITAEANVGDQIDDNKREQNDEQREIPGLGQKVAHIPPTVGLYWLNTYGVDVWSGDPDHRRAVMVLLNQPEWRHLRTNSWDLGLRNKTIFHKRGDSK